MHFGRSLNWIDLSASRPLAADDLPFHHYTLRHRTTAWVSRNLFDRFTYTVRHGLIRGMKRKGGLGWLPAWLSPGVEPREEIFWRGLPLDGLVIYDVGAFHGILTLFFATRGARVIAYEPNDGNHARLIENITLNGLTNVQVRKFGVGAALGSGTLHFSPEMAGGGTLNPNGVATMSQLVEITTLDHDIAADSLPAPDLIKIDIEGWELAALEGMRRTLDANHPALFLEMHGDTMREKKSKASAIVAFLRSAGYTDIVHVETGVRIAPGNETAAAEGHLYCICPTNTSSVPQKASSES
jgi:FkbM family methyltransferase